MADLKTRMGRISQTRRSLVNLPQVSGSGTNLDPADLHSPVHINKKSHGHMRHSSRVDVINEEKEELAAEDNSMSQQDRSEKSDVAESPGFIDRHGQSMT